MQPPFKVLGINHVAFAPKEVEQTQNFFTEALGLKFLGEEIVTDQKVGTFMYASSQQNSEKASRLEILDPGGFEDSPVAKFLDKKGAGLHHIAMTVDSIDKALEWMQKKGVKMIDSAARRGAHNTKIAFVHPHATGGVLIELVEQL